MEKKKGLKGGKNGHKSKWDNLSKSFLGGKKTYEKERDDDPYVVIHFNQFRQHGGLIYWLKTRGRVNKRGERDVSGNTGKEEEENNSNRRETAKKGKAPGFKQENLKKTKGRRRNIYWGGLDRRGGGKSAWMGGNDELAGPGKKRSRSGAWEGKKNPVVSERNQDGQTSVRWWRRRRGGRVSGWLGS